MIDSNFPKHRKLYVIYARNTKDIYHIMKQYLHNLARKKLPNIASLNARYNQGYRKQSVSKSFGQTSSASLCTLRKEQSSSTCDLTSLKYALLFADKHVKL